MSLADTTATDIPAARGSANPPAAAGVLLAAAITLSAFLLFQVQPLIGKFILPWFGGSAGVWTTCMLFFQVMLLAGYLYAHLSVTCLTPRWQGILHAALVAVAIVTLPVVPADRWKPTSAANPAPQILALLLATLGLPYFVLSATAPLLQAWFARSFPHRSPYRLYALSNVASLTALLTFPFVIEPLLSRRSQAFAWSAGYLAFAACLTACLALLWKRAGDEPAPSTTAEPVASGDPPRPPLIHYLLWLLLPACASLMLLAVTNKLCLDVAPVPFLWVVPLAIYLVTFIICFDSPRWYRRSLFGPLLFAAAAAGAYAISYGGDWGIGAGIAALSLALFACCMTCHGELVALKPDPRRLTVFYLMVAAGGAAGGVFVALVAPLVFVEFLELHIGLASSCLLFLAALAANPNSPLYRFRLAPVWFLLILLVGLLIAALYAHSTLRFIETPLIARTRNFHGVIDVFEADEGGTAAVVILHNGITHGVQSRDPARRRETTVYYRKTSGVGRLLSALESRPIRVGMIGLGAGTLAAAGKSGDFFRFYELDPDVERLARSHFTFLADSPATIEVVLGDARLSMERESPQGYDALVLDAFSGDGVPTHLLTREVMATYLRHLKPDGVIAFHISNRHLDLAPVVAALARTERLHTLFLKDGGYILWALAARDPAPLDALRPFASPDAAPTSERLWTDDHASLFPLLRWHR